MSQPGESSDEIEELAAEPTLSGGRLPSKGGVNDLLDAPRELIDALRRTGAEGVQVHKEIGTLIHAVRSFTNNEDWMNAAAVSFYAILSFIPFLLLMLSVLGFVTHGHTQGSLEQFDQLLEPIQGYAFVTPEVVEKLRGVVAARGAIGATGLVILVIMGGAVFRGLEVSVWRIWRGGEIRKGSLKTVVLSRLLFGAFAMGSVLLMMVVDWVFSAGLPLLERFAPELFLRTWSVLDAYVPISTLLDRLVIAGGFIILLKYLTRFRVKWLPALRGGVLFSLLWWIASSGFHYYLGQAQINAVYGAFSALIIIVLWTFYSSLILLLSIEYAYAWQLVRTGRWDSDSDS
jgi:membrane protein